MKKEATHVIVNLTIKHVDEEGKIVGVRESETVKMNRVDFEDSMYQLSNNRAINPRAPSGLPENAAQHRKMFVKLFRRWIVDNFLTVEK